MTISETTTAPSEDGPSSARMYDYFLGGDHNLEVDRLAGDAIRKIVPQTPELVWENRLFLGRAVRHLSSLGIRQFVDIGPGLPTRGSTHEVVRSVDKEAKVVYVDNDPTVIRMSQGLLSGDAGAMLIPGDLREPQSIVEALRGGALIDLSKPVALLVVAVLQFVADSHRPHEILGVLREAMAPGSYLVLTHLTTTGLDADTVDRITGVYRNASAQIVFRPAADIERLFAGFELIAPGFVQPAHWRPESDDPPATGWLRAGVGRRP